MTEKDLLLQTGLARTKLPRSAISNIIEFLFETPNSELEERHIHCHVSNDGIDINLGSDSILLLSNVFNIPYDKLVNSLNLGYSLVEALSIEHCNLNNVNKANVDTRTGKSFSVLGEACYFDNNRQFINYIYRLKYGRGKKCPETKFNRFNSFIMMGCTLLEAQEQMYNCIINGSDKIYRLDNIDITGTPTWLSRSELRSYIGLTCKPTSTTVIEKAIRRYATEYKSCLDLIKQGKPIENTKYVHLGFSEYIRRLVRERNISYNGILYDTINDLCVSIGLRQDEYRKNKIKYGDILTAIDSCLTSRKRGTENE